MPSPLGADGGAMSLSLIYDPLLSRVRVSADGLTGYTTALIERSTNQVNWTTVRGGTAVPVVTGAAALDDYEFTDGVPNFYRVTGQVREGFEDAGLDIAVTGTWARSSADSRTGAWSFKSAVIGSSATTDAVVTPPAGAVSVSFWYRVSSEANFDFFRFLLDAVVQFSDSGEKPWTERTFSLAGVTTVTFRYTKDGSAVAGDDAAYVDDIVFTGPSQTNSISPALDAVWLKSLARPFLNRKVTVAGWSDVERQSRSGVFPIVGRSFPIAVTDLHGSRQWTLDVAAATPAEAKELDLLISTGEIQFIHVPAAEQVPGGYVALGDTTERRPRPRATRRILSLPLTEVAAPGPDIVPAVGTWQTVLNTYPTWADVLAAHATWSDLLQLVGSPADVVVP